MDPAVAAPVPAVAAVAGVPAADEPADVEPAALIPAGLREPAVAVVLLGAAVPADPRALVPAWDALAVPAVVASPPAICVGPPVVPGDFSSPLQAQSKSSVVLMVRVQFALGALMPSYWPRAFAFLSTSAHNDLKKSQAPLAAKLGNASPSCSQ